jgi:hypothetical protein
MPVRTTVLWFAVLIAVSVTSSDATDSRLRIEVTPKISMAPAMLRIRAIVTPDAANRALQIVAESGAYYRSSMVPLDGANAAAITETIFKDLPGGEYEVMVILVGADGRRISDRRQVTVTSMRLGGVP